MYTQSFEHLNKVSEIEKHKNKNNRSARCFTHACKEDQGQ